MRALILALLLGASPAAMARAPDLVLIVADDLAFADIGAFGGEIPTPNLDRLAATGNRLDQFHVSPTCSPTRAMLLTGTDAHRAGLGTMEELVTPAQRGKPAYRGTLAPDAVTLAERLQPLGYRTLFAGKWHLGADAGPDRRGFQSSLALMEAGHHHFGADAGRGATYRDNGQPVAPLPAGFFSSTAFADRLIADIRATPADTPVLAVLSFTAPHWPLMERPAAIARQKGRYDAGPDALRAARIAAQKRLSLVPADAKAAPMELAPGDRWEAMSPEARAASARRMEVHAAMVAGMDAEVGRLLEALKETGRDGTSVILFLSDNGADAIDLERAAAGFRAAGLGAAPGGGHNPFADAVARADNSLDSLGGPASWAAYGPAWAQAGGGILRLWKGFPAEGGTRVAAILRLPDGRPGPVTARLDVRDVVPTFLELAGASVASTAMSEAAKQPITGRSWVPLLRGSASTVHGPEDALPMALFGARSLRMGDWKLMHLGAGRWELYDLATDPGETDDRAAAEPARVVAMAMRWQQWADAVGVVPPERPIPMLMRPGQRPPGPPPGALP